MATSTVSLGLYSTKIQGMPGGFSQLPRVKTQLVLTALVVLPVVYELGGIQGFWRAAAGVGLGVVVAFLTTLKSRREVALDVSLLFGLAGGLGGGLLVGIPRGSLSGFPSQILILAIYSIFGIIVGLHGPIANMFYAEGPGRRRFVESWWGGAIQLFFLFVMPFSALAYIYYQGYGYTLDDSIALALPSTVFLGGLGVFVGKVMGRKIAPIVQALDQVLGYLKSMGPPVVAFVLGYLFISFIFAGLYGALWRAYPDSFSGLPPSPTFSDFCYYSAVTISTLGDAVIRPLGFARLLVCFEVIIGVGWITVVLAAVIALLQDQFGRNKRTPEVHASDRRP
jgi:hypothetical protein